MYRQWSVRSEQLKVINISSSPWCLGWGKVSVNVTTLERWRSEALLQSKGKRIWTAAARLEAVVVNAAVGEEANSAWCREKGLYRRPGETFNGCFNPRRRQLSCIDLLHARIITTDRFYARVDNYQSAATTNQKSSINRFKRVCNCSGASG